MTRVRVEIPARSEASIETAACERITKMWPHAVIRKLNGFSNRNWPDRMILFRGGKSVFVEFKKPGEKLRPGQAWFKHELEQLGFTVLVADNADALLAQLVTVTHDWDFTL